GAFRCVHPEPNDNCSRGLRVSEKRPSVGMWHPAQATLPVSPFRPKVPLVPSFASSSSGPENRVSKKNFCPSAAAFASSAHRLLLSGLRGALLGKTSVASRALISAVSGPPSPHLALKSFWHGADASGPFPQAVAEATATAKRAPRR